MFALRSVLRRVALSSLAGLGSATGFIDPALARKRVHFLLMHGLPADQETAFRALLTRLQRSHRFISYSEAAARVSVGEIDSAYLAFSFDDGFASCRRAARALEQFGVSAAFFVCPGFVGTRDLESAGRFFGVGPGSPHEVEPAMTWDDLAELKSNGHEIGSHTMSHIDLAGASPSQLEDEIEGSMATLTARLGQTRHFAWPYGRFRYFSPAAAAAVFRAGFETCASGERGCHPLPSTLPRPQLCLRRDNLEPGAPLAHQLFFLARSSRKASPADNLWPAGWSEAIP